MVYNLFLAVGLTSIAWSLFIRRTTWQCRWEAAITVTTVLQAVAMVLLSPLASTYLSQPLHSIFGLWNVEDFIGHLFCVAAASGLVYHLICRLGDDEIFQYRWTQYIQRPLTVIVPILTVCFINSEDQASYHRNMLSARPDWWLDAYWVILCGFVIYAMIYAGWATLIIREDPRSRVAANVYLIASVLGSIACAVKIITAFDIDLGDSFQGRVVWVFLCVSCVFYALGSAFSWLAKRRYLKAHMWQNISKGKDITRYRTEPSV